jgi:RNA polymerase sigma-70 factor (ECF subfamily)
MTGGSRSDAANLHAWVVRYGPALRRYFLRRAPSSDADDLVQDVFLMMQARGATTEIENVEGYLFRTAANVLGQRHRHRTWPWGSQEDIDEVDGLADFHSPERILIGKQALEMLMRLIDELPPRTAQAFILYRFENLTRQAVGRKMGISAKAVEALLKRAFQRLYAQSEWRP